MLSFTEENYLKALLQIRLENGSDFETGTNQLATYLGVKPATATDMLKKLKEKSFVEYEKYGKVILSESGYQLAIDVLRKHRLWETFLHDKLDFSWDEVHELAEQLEHIQSQKLIDSLDKLLNYPDFDPHGDPIPNAKGEMKVLPKKTLSEVFVGEKCKMVAVKDNTADFLQYVVKVGLGINTDITVLNIQTYDGLMELEVNGQKTTVGKKFTDNIIVI